MVKEFKKSFLLLGLLGVFGIFPKVAFAAVLSLSSQGLSGQSETFIPHNTQGAEYLAMAIGFSPVERTLNELNQEFKIRGVPLIKGRGEAHITVLTPPEYLEIAPYISMDQVNKIAHSVDIQRTAPEVSCLGVGRKDEKSTYFLVVKKASVGALFEIRRKVQSLLPADKRKLIDPEHFYPHVTVGFTERDLHESDGVVKDEKSCDSSFSLSGVNQVTK